jgi:hypothetical protein
MIVNVDFDELKVGNYVLVMSKSSGFLAHGKVVKVASSESKLASVEITSFDTTGINIMSCIDRMVPDNRLLKIGKTTWFFADTEVFHIMDDDK